MEITKEQIEALSAANGNADKLLVEKHIRALVLLTELRKTNLDFIFKGGTALMLMLTKPSRLSIDIDIIISRDTVEIEQALTKVIESERFTKYELQHRFAGTDIVKLHYKFYYRPAIVTHSIEEYILLDILLEDCPYSSLQETEVRSSFYIPDVVTNVKTPTIDNILGDKLTAYAPNTTGIPYFKGKTSRSMEIIKQLYDIGNLFDDCTDINVIAETFRNNALIELKYRNLMHLSSNDVLSDIIQTSFCISTRGQAGNCNFTELQAGISRIKPYIFSAKYYIEEVIISASKAAYCASLLLNHAEAIDRYTGIEQIQGISIVGIPYNKLNKLRNTNPEAFFYWHLALKQMSVQ